jgi:hypothetical protein
VFVLVGQYILEPVGALSLSVTPSSSLDFPNLSLHIIA